MNMRFTCPLICAAVLGVMLPQPAAAHRLDEYLQATRISVERNRVNLEIDLTAGVAVADKVMALIDTNGDGKISDTEGAEYANGVLGSMILKLDNQRRYLTLTRNQFPSFQDMRQGEGIIRMQATATIPSSILGRHELEFVNTHQPDIGVYLINALVPADNQIRITSQRRDTLQHEFKMDYRVVAPGNGLPVSWLLLAGLGLVTMVWRKDLLQRARQPGAIVFGLLLASMIAQAQTLPTTIDDRVFWRMVTEMSEAGGNFPRQYMSNEDSAQFVIPELKRATRPGGVYVGVGLEQNFTYIAAVQPRLAFIVDIRRDNMMEHLVYKALFEISQDRADFLSRLLSRKRPAGLNTNSSAKALFDAYQPAVADSALYDDTLRLIVDRLTNSHKLPLTATDKADLQRILNVFRTTDPNTLRGQGDNTNPTYAQLMTATDLDGRSQSYLASEANFKVVQDLELQNLVVPLVGDFAGSKAIVNVGNYLKEHRASVNVFYVSNVERYLFDQGDDAKKFYTNVAALPLDASSTFIRSVTSDISIRLGIPIPDSTAKWRSFLVPINDTLKTFAAGRLQSYRDLFVSPATTR